MALTESCDVMAGGHPRARAFAITATDQRLTKIRDFPAAIVLV